MTQTTQPNGVELVGEPLVEDKRLWAVAEQLGVIFPKLPVFGYDLVTWIQEPLVLTAEGGRPVTLPRVAVLAVVSPHPKDKDRERMTKMAMWFDDWDTEEKMRSHYAGAPDPLLKFYKPVIREHLKALQNSQDLIE